MNIVQIGTNRSYDYLSKIILSIDIKDINQIVLVEPFEIHNNSIKQCYFNYLNKIFIENIIISPNLNHNKFNKLWYHPDDLTHLNSNELASLDPNHAKKIRSNYKVSDMQYKNCFTMTINSLFNKYLMSTIDILYIDTEGYDDQIIYTIDFDQFNIKKIYYEHIHINSVKLADFLTKHNYNIVSPVQDDPYSSMAIQICQ